MKKLIAFNIMLLIILTACASTTESDTTDNNVPDSSNVSETEKDSTPDDTTEEDATSVDDTANNTSQTFTLEELSQYNGQDGNPAYIAIDGVVYDVTDNPMWKNGQHQGQFQAGADLTEAMKGAPHGLSKLSGLDEVGTLVE